MQVAVLSDIHSNYRALEAVFEECGKRQIENYLFLGDYVTDCAYPRKTMELLREAERRWNCKFIRGNREEYLLNHRLSGESGWQKGSANGALLYTYRQLLEKDFIWMGTLDLQGTQFYEEVPPLSLCHGSPWETRGRLMQDRDLAVGVLESLSQDVLLCGHTHRRGVFSYRGKKLVNPGSVGMSPDVPGKASFALLTWSNGSWQEEFCEAAYDVQAAVRELKESGLVYMAPVWTAMTCHVLLTGEVLFPQVLARVQELAALKNDTPEGVEQLWEQAAAEAGMPSYF